MFDEPCKDSAHARNLDEALSVHHHDAVAALTRTSKNKAPSPAHLRRHPAPSTIADECPNTLQLLAPHRRASLCLHFQEQLSTAFPPLRTELTARRRVSLLARSPESPSANQGLARALLRQEPSRAPLLAVAVQRQHHIDLRA